MTAAEKWRKVPAHVRVDVFNALIENADWFTARFRVDFAVEEDRRATAFIIAKDVLREVLVEAVTSNKRVYKMRAPAKRKAKPKRGRG